MCQKALHNVGFCTIYPTAFGVLGGPQTPGLLPSFAWHSPPTFSKWPSTFESVESPAVVVIFYNN
jgi:hypothetical protein